MPIGSSPSKLPVLLIFNLDPDWSKREQGEVFEVTSQLDKEITRSGYQTTLVPVTDKDLDKFLRKFDPLEYIVFNWCENLPGIAHSEWVVAEYLERRGFTFTGASSSTLALAQNKCSVKQLLDNSGIPTPRWEIFNNTTNIRWNRFPAIVKPSQEHGSEGISREAVVLESAELKARIGYILEKYQQPVLVEDFIDGRELHVSLWENGSIDMLPPAEMEFSSFRDKQDHICSYEGKFVPESEQYQKIKTVLPAPLTENEFLDTKMVCQAAYVAAGCRDYARIDMRIKEGIHYVIDVNPNADLSPDTSTIAAAELAGYSYGDFGARIIARATRRHPVYQEQIVIEEQETASFTQ